MKISLAVVVVIGIAGAFIAGMQFGPAKETVKVQYDTLSVMKEVPIEKIVYRRLPAQLDTVMVHVRDTIYVAQPVARLDTVLAPHNDSLRIAYWFPPVNQFAIDFAPGPREVETKEIWKTVTVYKDPSFFEKLLYIGAGSAIGFTAGALSK